MSGQLVQFNALAAAVMACLEESPHNAVALGSSIASDLALPLDAGLGLFIEHVVQAFAELGWIEPVRP